MVEAYNMEDHAAAQAVLTAAARLFADKGYVTTSMREIAEAAGVAKPTIYYYFKSKEGLFDALLERGVSSLCGRLKEINARDDSFDPRKCLEDAVLASFEFAAEHSDLNRFIHSLVFSPPLRPERKAIEKAFARVMEEFREVLARAAEAGLLDASRIAAAAVAFRGCIMAYIVNHLQGRMKLTEELAREVVDGLVSGYGKDRDACSAQEPK